MGAVDTTYTFTATDTITSAKMNNIIDQTTMTSSAIIGTTLEVASGQLKVRSQGITSNEMGTSSVTTDAIANGAVTPAKFSAGGPSWNSVTGTLSISQPQVEVGMGITTNTASLIDFHSVHPLTDYEARIIRYSGTNGGMAIEQTGSGGISVTSPNGVFLASANVPNPVGSAPIFGARAWGVISLTAPRSVASQANIASATKIDTTHTQIIFVTAMPDDVYVVSGCVKNDAALDFSTYDHQTTGFKIRHSTEGSGRFVQFMVIR
jgi:hypothetical protein